jgi:hypothetical protein
MNGAKVPLRGDERVLGVKDLCAPTSGLKALRDQANTDAERAQIALDSAGN